MARWDQYVDLTAVLGSLTLLARDDGQANPSDEVRTVTLARLAGWALAEVTTYMEGLKLSWDSGTSVTVGTGWCVAENGDVINVSSALVKSSLSLSNSTWYHVYVYLSSGVAAAEVVTTAPVAWKGTAYSKTGDTSRRYVGSIKTNGSGSVYEFWHELPSNVMYYKNVSAAASPFRVLSGGTATTATSVSCSGVVPVTSRVARLRFYNDGTQAAYTNEGSGVTSSIYIMGLLAVGIQAHGVHPLNSSQALYYLVTAGGSLYIDVLGYQFDR